MAGRQPATLPGLLPAPRSDKPNRKDADLQAKPQQRVPARRLPARAAAAKPKVSSRAERIELTLPDQLEDLPEEYQDLKEPVAHESYEASRISITTPKLSPSAKSPRVVSPSARSPSAKSPKSKTPARRTPAGRSPGAASPRPKVTNDANAAPFLLPGKVTVAAAGNLAARKELGALGKKGNQPGTSPKAPVLPAAALPALTGRAAAAQTGPPVADRPLPGETAIVPTALPQPKSPFEKVPLFKPPLLPRRSLWSPGGQTPAPGGYDDGPQIVSNYVQGPLSPLPPDEIFSAKQVAMVVALILLFFVVVVAWAKLTGRGGIQLDDNTERSNSTRNQYFDDFIIMPIFNTILPHEDGDPSLDVGGDNFTSKSTIDSTDLNDTVTTN